MSNKTAKHILKTAKFTDTLKSTGKLMGAMGLLTIPVAAGAAGVDYLADRYSAGRSYEKGLKRLKSHSPELFRDKKSREQTQTYLRTLNRLSPTMSEDPVLANSWVQKVRQLPEGVLGMAHDVRMGEPRKRPSDTWKHFTPRAGDLKVGDI